MMVKFAALVFVVLLQIVLSQQQQQQQQQQQPLDFVGSGLTAAQLWNPNTWSMPYYAAASQAWADYLKKAQEASNQLYKQWDNTGAGNLLNTGMGLGQQAASQAQQAGQAAVDKAQSGAQMAADNAKEGVNQATQGAQAAAAQAQQLLPKA